MRTSDAAKVVTGVLAGLLVVLGLAGCSDDRSSGLSPTTGPPARPRVGTDLTLADASRCAVTVPRSGPSVIPREDFFGWENSYGNGRLWVGALWPEGIVVADRRLAAPDGSVGLKFGWWRGVPGHLEIRGRRLDAAAPSLRARVPSGYGESGFQSSGVTFPTEGCWEVTGTIGRAASLTFRTFVVRRSA
ncbi:hypothetical protein [Actinopolymorpha pittospori]|uniref:Lipoprotein n=1 Tax=Actinopolymorpha pittospori TaxID=648752 RepID=A0A927MYA9_9ACTN|nr:hypothetical protein [Actinopolymorpha pittospori]MBE1605410.1 hypothetical protein [Actinopolymorpha pittospori]